jgi:epoxyqueuosine reductase QueG
MIGLFRRRTATIVRGVTFCDTCAQVCTADCRAATRRDQIRTAAMSHLPSWR